MVLRILFLLRVCNRNIIINEWLYNLLLVIFLENEYSRFKNIKKIYNVFVFEYKCYKVCCLCYVCSVCVCVYIGI